VWNLTAQQFAAKSYTHWQKTHLEFAQQKIKSLTALRFATTAAWAGRESAI
jgi:hypothetical protein